MRLRLAVFLALLLAPATAFAGRSFYGWLYGTDVLPERGAELATWLAEQNDLKDEDHLKETRWWTAGLIGINDQLELALPVEFTWDISEHTAPRTIFDRYGAELRYRFVTSDPVDAPPLVPLLRVAVYRSIIERETWIPEADLVSSYNQGRLQVLADVGGYGEITPNPQPGERTTHFEIHPGIGFSVRATGELRFGAELHAELSFDNSAASWAVAGPNMAWSHGRSWLSAAYGIGFYGIRDAPRVQWGIAF